MMSAGKLGVVLVAHLREYGEVTFRGTMPMLSSLSLHIPAPGEIESNSRMDILSYSYEAMPLPFYCTLPSSSSTLDC